MVIEGLATVVPPASTISIVRFQAPVAVAQILLAYVAGAPI